MSLKAKRKTEPAELLKRLRKGDQRALALVLRWIDDRAPEARLALESFGAASDDQHRLGITGAPGSGKSTLVDCLISSYRRDEKQVGILAIDPSSPFSGGAILGDRIRMGAHSEDPGVFIRSLATRGAMGGLSRSTADSIKALESAGFDLMVIETVGTGQDEVDVMGIADTTVLVLTPEAGDEVQAIKAGLMEIADILIVNKSDREGADRCVMDLQYMLSIKEEAGGPQGWTPPIVKTVASHGKGIDSLREAITQHQIWLKKSGEGEKRAHQRLESEFTGLVIEGLGEKILEKLRKSERWEKMIADVLAYRIDPYTLADKIAAEFLK